MNLEDNNNQNDKQSQINNDMINSSQEQKNENINNQSNTQQNNNEENHPIGNQAEEQPKKIIKEVHHKRYKLFNVDDFKDVEPIPEFSDKVEILQIQYSYEYRTIMDYFRGILTKNEISVRAYNLTTILLERNATNYTAWHLRRKCLDMCKELSLQEEIEWLDSIMVANQKNYQIWYHRKILIEKMNDPSREINILNKVFGEDSKNFHAWCHRIWVMRRFDICEGEFDYIEKMLTEDIKNNSVWNYRFFLVNYEKIGKNPSDELVNEVINEEINYAIEKIKICPVNESAYSYLRGFLTTFKKSYSEFPQIKKLILDISNKGSINHTLSMLVDIYEEEKEYGKASEIIDELIVLDYIRKKYWGWRKQNLPNIDKAK